MRYKQPRDIKKSFANAINKVFTLNQKWFNEDVEVITLSGDNSPEAFEQYPWDKEDYPIAVVFSEGLTDDHWAIDSRIGNYWITLKLGTTPKTYTTLSGTPIAFGVTSGDLPLNLRSVDLALTYKGPYEDDILVKLWSSSGGIPDQVLASGSISGKESTQMKWYSTSLTPNNYTLQKNTNYFISAQTVNEYESYYLMIDNNINSSITPWARYTTSGSTGWSTPDETQSVLARVNGPVYRRLGGGFNTSIRIFIESKDLATTQKITDLLYVYFHLLKHSNPYRKDKLTTPNETATQYDFVSDLSDEGIYIIDVNKGPETVRNRGNDRLFSVDLTIACYGNWVEDFGLPSLEDINIDNISEY